MFIQLNVNRHWLQFDSQWKKFTCDDNNTSNNIHSDNYHKYSANIPLLFAKQQSVNYWFNVDISSS